VKKAWQQKHVSHMKDKPLLIKEPIGTNKASTPFHYALKNVTFEIIDHACS